MADASEEGACDLTQLAERAKKNETALSQLMARLQPLITRWVAQRLENHEDVLEVVQESQLKVWQGLPKFDPSVASIQAWARRIAYNSATDRGRRLKVRRAVPLPEEGRELADKSTLLERQANHPAPAESLLGSLPELLARLAPDERRPIELHYLEGRTHAEAATVLGITPEAFNSRLTRARSRLREIAEEQMRRQQNS
jgi:RNA polymerase sigma-70 factor (ECF subfamily)